MNMPFMPNVHVLEHLGEGGILYVRHQLMFA